MLLISGADPNIIDINDRTPLLYALKLNEITNYDDFYNFTYLHIYGKPIIELLLKYGADPRKKIIKA
jgi:ankyrin repeat protein